MISDLKSTRQGHVRIQGGRRMLARINFCLLFKAPITPSASKIEEPSARHIHFLPNGSITRSNILRQNNKDNNVLRKWIIILYAKWFLYHSSGVMTMI